MNYYPYQYQPQPQYQLPTQPVNHNSMIGRMVSNYNEITANDVPMNGSYAFFPKADMSEIAVKNWNSQGRIETHFYKLSDADIQSIDNSVNDSVPNELKEALKGFDTRLDKIERLLTNSKAKGKKNESTDVDTASAE